MIRLKGILKILSISCLVCCFSLLSLVFSNAATEPPQSAIYSGAAGTFLNSIFPSSLGAVGLGQVLNQNALIIMQRLRETRAAIDEAGGGQLSTSVSNQAWSIIQDPSDRARLSRYLEQLEYLTGLVKTAWNDQESTIYVDAVKDKLAEIDDIFVKWTGQPSGITEPASRFAGNWACGNVANLEIYVTSGGSLEGDVKGHTSMSWIKKYHGGSLTGIVRPIPTNKDIMEANITFHFATGDKAVGEHFMLHKNDTRLSSPVGYFKPNNNPAGGIMMFCDRESYPSN